MRTTLNGKTVHGRKLVQLLYEWTRNDKEDNYGELRIYMVYLNLLLYRTDLQQPFPSYSKLET